MREVILIPQLGRYELLFCCLKRIRAIEPKIEIHLFPDRGTFHEPVIQTMTKEFELHCHFVPDHDFFGNTSNVLNAYLWAFNAGYERIFYLESDVMPHVDFFSWHRQQHEEFPDIFASMGWIFNRHAPIVDDLLFQSWLYSIGLCISRKKLALIIEHATPKYFGDMAGYIGRTFPRSTFNKNYEIGNFAEQDGLLQRIMERDKSQTVCPGIAKCSHVGFTRSYGGDTQEDYERFLGLDGLRFDERVDRVEEFIADLYARAEVFSRAVVEREIGYVLPDRSFRYRIELDGGWSSEFTTELNIKRLPRRINSVCVDKSAKISVL